MKITVIWDLILDKDIYTSKKHNKEGAFYCGNEDAQLYYAWWAGLVAENLATMGHDVTLLTSWNLDNFKDKIIMSQKIKLVNVTPEINSHPCVKNRVIDNESNNVIVRYDWDDVTIPWKFNSKYWKNADAIVVADYNKGTITKELIDRLPKEKLFVDTKPCHMDWYKLTNFLKCNKSEFEEYAKWKILYDVAKDLDINCLCVTKGEDGASFHAYWMDYIIVPDYKWLAANVCWAWDLFLSVVVDCYHTCYDFEDAIEKAVNICSERVLGNQRCVAIPKDWAWADAVVVTGCFDILHPWHLELLRRARLQWSNVIVLLNSDEYIEEVKWRQSVFDWNDRATMLKATKYVDKVIWIDNDEQLEEFLRIIKPKWRMLGSDYKDKKIIWKKYCENIIFVDNDWFSTTKIIQWIIWEQSS